VFLNSAIIDFISDRLL